MHNDVKQCFRGSNVHCGSCSNEEGNLNDSNANICSDVVGTSSSGSGDLFELSDWSNKTDPVLFPPQLALLAAILYLSVTTTVILPFGACYIMRKVYYIVTAF